MFKKTMKFDDLNENEVTQTFYFNYNKKEIAELLEFGQVMKFAEPGTVKMPLEEMLKKLTTPREEQGLSQQENNQQAYDIFQDLILDAYGIKEDDDVTFTKSKELRERWSNHVAFPEMIFEFLGNEKLAAEFLEKCLPAKLVARAKEEMEAEQAKQLSRSTIHEMNEEAARRQEDPATRIEPGLENAPEHIRAGFSETVTTSEQASAKKPEDLTADDILVLSDEDFNKLDPRRLSQPAMLAAFQRKSQG